MGDKKGNIILGIILAILMVIAIVIVIVNPNRVATVNYARGEEESNNFNNDEQTTSEITKISKEELKNEEKQTSMQTGGKFCKIGTTAVFYEGKNKCVYTYKTKQAKK